MRIGALSRRTGVSPRSLRYYEEQGMLTSTRTAGGHREYAEPAVDRVIRIQELFAAGLRSDTIADILPCMRNVDGGPSAEATPLLLRPVRPFPPGRHATGRSRHHRRSHRYGAAPRR